MNKEFCTHEQSLDFKKLGFDEPCFGYYNKNNSLVRFPSLLPNIEICNSYFLDLDKNSITTAPLKQQAFKFFRDKYDLQHYIKKSYEFKKYFYTITRDGIIIDGTTAIDICNTYEEAEEACLDKLILICKEQNEK
jgi:hypothetical protein